MIFGLNQDFPDANQQSGEIEPQTYYLTPSWSANDDYPEPYWQLNQERGKNSLQLSVVWWTEHTGNTEWSTLKCFCDWAGEKILTQNLSKL